MPKMLSYVILETRPKNVQFSWQEASGELLLVAVCPAWLWPKEQTPSQLLLIKEKQPIPVDILSY